MGIVGIIELIILYFIWVYLFNCFFILLLDIMRWRFFRIFRDIINFFIDL